MPLVSIIIPAFERPKDLMLCLRSFQFQTMPDFEIIVVDNGSKVRLEETMSGENFSLRLSWLRLTSENARASARNLGLSHAKGEFVLFWDADMIASSSTVQAHTESAETNSENCVTIGRRLLINMQDIGLLNKDSSWQVQEFPKLKGRAKPDPRDVYFEAIGWDLAKSEGPWRAAFTCNLSMPLKLISEHGGFDPDFDGAYGYEDLDFAYRLFCNGTEFILQRDAFGYHIDHPPLSGVDHNRQKLRNLRLFRMKHPGAGVWW